MAIRFVWIPPSCGFLWQFERNRTFFYDADSDMRFEQQYLWLRIPFMAVRIAGRYKKLP